MLTEDWQTGQFDKNKKKHISFYQNLGNGILYYSGLPCVSDTSRETFNRMLKLASIELDCLNYKYEFN